MMKVLPGRWAVWCKTAALVSHSPPLCFIARAQTHIKTWRQPPPGSPSYLFPGIPAFSCQLRLVFFFCFVFNFPFPNICFQGLLIFVNMLRANPESTDRKVQFWYKCFLFLLLLLDSSLCWPHSGSAAAVITFLCLQLGSDCFILLHYSPVTFFHFLLPCLIKFISHVSRSTDVYVHLFKWLSTFKPHVYLVKMHWYDKMLWFTDLQ